MRGLLVLCLVSTTAVAAGNVHRVALPELRVVGELPPRVAAAVSQALSAELRKLDGVAVMTASEIADLLSLERQRQLLGCSDDQALCLAEVAGALDADDLLTFELSQIARRYTLSIKRFDARQARLLEGYTRTVDRGDGEELLALIGPAVQALYPDRMLRPGRTRGVDVEVARRLNPPPLPAWGMAITGSVAVGALGGGLVFGMLTQEAQRDLDSLVEQSRSGVPVAAREVQLIHQRGSERAQVANTLFAVAAGAAVLGGVQALFTNWSGAAPPVRAALTPGPSGVVLVFGGEL